MTGTETTPTKATNAEQEPATSSDVVKFFAHYGPLLESGEYTADFVQTVEEPTPSGQTHTLLTTQKFVVPGPQFSLDVSTDIHSVFPAPGHSDYANTLAHVVFNDPSLPWQRSVGQDITDSNVVNRTPWLAVISFTEDELQISESELTRLKCPSQGYNYTVAITSKDLAGLTSVSSSLNSKTPVEFSDKKVQPVNCIILRRKLFKTLFAAQSSASKPDLNRYASLAHIQKVQDQARDIPNAKSMEKSHSIVLSHRTGPLFAKHPVSVVTHLVAIEGAQNLDLSDGNNNEYFALVSLHSWTWMSLTMDSDIVNVMHSLGKTLQPLRMKDEILKSLDKPNDSLTDNSDAIWLYRRLKRGFVFRNRIDSSGQSGPAMYRGPLITTLPARDGNKSRNLSSKRLEIVDKDTGIIDLSYQAAWELGHLLAIRDYTFLTSLLRFRGVLTSQASMRVRESLAPDFMNMAKYLDMLPSAMSLVASAQSPSNVGAVSAIFRWFDGWESVEKPQQSVGRTISITKEFVDQISQIATNISRAKTADTSAPSAAHTKTSATVVETNANVAQDLEYILAWISGVLHLDWIPINYLIPDLESLPSESLRTFFVDPLWLETVVDGALCHANHLQTADDVIKRQIQICLNEYLQKPWGQWSGNPVRLPRWGFLIRSLLISSHSELKVEATSTSSEASHLNPVLLVKRLSEDVLLCLLDQIPGHGTKFNVTFSQPSHQQGFAFGFHLDEKVLDLKSHSVPEKTGAKVEGIEQKPRRWFNNPSSGQGEAIPIFDWENRTIKLDTFANVCKSALNQNGLFKWTKPSNEQHGVIILLI